MPRSSESAWPFVLRVKQWMRGFRKNWARIVDARLSLVAIALGALVLFLSQGLDVVRDLVDSSNVYLVERVGILSRPALITYFRWACFVAACVWSGVIAWYWPHLLTRARTAAHEPQWFIWLRRALGLAPLAAALIAVWRVGDSWRDVVIGLATMVIALLSLLAFFVFRPRLFARPSRLMRPLMIRLGGRRDVRLSLGDDLFALFTFGVSLLLLLLFSIPGVRTDLAVGLGSAAIAFGAVGSIVASLSALLWLLAGSRVPAISLGIVAVLLFSTLNDNHAIHQLDSDLVRQRPGIDTKYREWEAKNPDGPVILVATAGGASRASYWTAAVLRALDDRTEGRFGRQVFAISSVSGGSLAAVGYAAWLADQPVGDPDCPYDPRRRLAFDQAVYGADHLSPAVAGLLYPDFVQQFIPFPLFPDRAVSLGEGWEKAWSTAVDADRGCGVPRANRLRRDFLEIWQRAPSRPAAWVPLVLVNGTLVEDGKRIITAPVQVDPAVFEDSHDFFKLSKGSVTASTAILNSARFPLISPAATVPYQDGNIHIVDGGYFENGGLETLYDVARYLRATLASTRPILIVEIANDDSAHGDTHRAYDWARYPNGMNPAGTATATLKVSEVAPTGDVPAVGIRSILRAFYMTRTSRGVLAAKRLSATRAAGLSNTTRVTFNLGPLLAQRRTAMSWSLSLSSRRAIDDSLQRLGPWMTPKHRERAAEAQRAQTNSTVDCQRLAAAQIASILGVSELPGEPRCRTGDFAQWVGVPLSQTVQ